MSASRIAAILRKDVVDALRDGRVVVALLIPLGLAIFHSLSAPAPGERPNVDLAVAGPADSRVVESVQNAVASGVDVRVRPVPDGPAARREVGDGEADLGLVLPTDIDAELRRGAAPEVEVLMPPEPNSTTRVVADVVPDALLRAGGIEAPARVTTSTVAEASPDASPVQRLDQGIVFVVLALVLYALMVGLLMVPILIAEELDTGTFAALRLAAPSHEILAAKSLAGVAFGGVGIALGLQLIDVDIDRPWLFVLAGVLLTATMSGFGLILGVLASNANQINTYSMFLILPLVGIAAAVLADPGGPLGVALDVLPFSQATTLMVDAASPATIFGHSALAITVLVLWTVAGHIALGRLVARREI